MTLIQFCLTIILFSVLTICNSYDPAAEQIKRLETYRKTCQKYNDDLTYEYQGEIFNIKCISSAEDSNNIFVKAIHVKRF